MGFIAQAANRAVAARHKELVQFQTQHVFNTIRDAIKRQQYHTRYTSNMNFNNELYPEVYNLLISYGYGVVCPDDDGKCWEISWDSNNNNKRKRKKEF